MGLWLLLDEGEFLSKPKRLETRINTGFLAHFRVEKRSKYMKATGIVRRIDDLGRVVIPKEIRRTMRIREGDPLEIFTNSGEVIFKKYSAVGEMSGLASQYAEALGESVSLPVLICDRDHCIAAAGISKKSVLEKNISADLEDIMENRKTVSFDDASNLTALEGLENEICVAAPILSSGDVNGAVVLVASEQGNTVSESDIKLVGVAASFLGKQME